MVLPITFENQVCHIEANVSAWDGLPRAPRAPDRYYILLVAFDAAGMFRKLGKKNKPTFRNPSSSKRKECFRRDIAWISYYRIIVPSSNPSHHIASHIASTAHEMRVLEVLAGDCSQDLGPSEAMQRTVLLFLIPQD